MRTFVGTSPAVPRGGRPAGRVSRIGAVAIVVAGSLLPGRLDARVVKIVVPVSGMTCALCTRGVEESIRRLKSVGDASADLGSATVQIRSTRDGSLEVEAVKRSIEEAGFEVAGRFDVEATGRFSIGPDRRVTFAITGTRHVYRVLENNQTLDLFRDHPGLKGDFVVEFALHEDPRWDPPAISIRGFRTVAAPADAAAGEAAPKDTAPGTAPAGDAATR